jgi:hypothetical protein
MTEVKRVRNQEREMRRSIPEKLKIIYKLPVIIEIKEFFICSKNKFAMQIGRKKL